VKDEAGRVIGASKIARDITGRKQLGATQGLLAGVVRESNDAKASNMLDGITTA